MYILVYRHYRTSLNVCTHTHVFIIEESSEEKKKKSPFKEQVGEDITIISCAAEVTQFALY